MATGGENVITPSGSSTSEFGIGHFLFYLFLLLAFVRSCTTNDGPHLAASTPPPAQPVSQFAVFESSDPLSDLLKIVLDGGSYEFSYETFAEAPKSGHAYGGDNTFTANFTDGTTTGDLNNADTIVIVGNVNLTVKDIYRNDSFKATIHDTCRAVAPKVVNNQ